MKRVGVVIPLVILLVVATPAAALGPANPSFQGAWDRVDKPIAEARTSRTWTYGPAIDTRMEPYTESPNGKRNVQYFDKGRMELTHPGSDPSAVWEVTDGLLAIELITGTMQVGDVWFEPHSPAQVNVAGDADDPTGPTYASFNPLRSAPPLADEAVITQRIDRAGTVTNDPSLSDYRVTAGYHVSVPNIDHQVASPFWDFMTSPGVVYENGDYVSARLFPSPFDVTGLPVTEAYWANVKVGGRYQDILVQCFERRCLTYTPANPPEWWVEFGNVGRHYYTWRYGEPQAQPAGRIAYIDQSVTFAIDPTVNIVRSDGSGSVETIANLGSGSAVAWSPDGTQIAFSTPPGDSHLWLANADGTNSRELTVDAGDLPFLAVTSWSPDGTRIMAGWSTAGGFETGILIINVDGSGYRKLPSRSGGSWSPDSTRIAITSADLKIAVVDLASGNTMDLTDGWAPIWSPTGEQIAFQRDGDIYRVNSDGTDLVQLTDRLPVIDMTWSPNGQHIAFTAEVPYDDSDPGAYDPEVKNLWTVDADGTDVKQLTVMCSCSGPSWSPDSRFIAYADGGHDMVGVIRVLNREHPEWAYAPVAYGVAPHWSPVLV